MAGEFRRTADGIEAPLDAIERDLLVHLLRDVDTLLRAETTTAEPLPDPSPGSPSTPKGTVPDWAAELGLGDLVGDEELTLPTEPNDPALFRLLPSASKDDPLVAGEFRRLTEQGLRSAKQQTLNTAITALDRADRGLLRLDDRQAAALTRAFTDVRLVLASRLGLETEDDADVLHDWLDHDDDGDDGDLPEEEQAGRWLARVYAFITMLQESLTTVLWEELPSEGDGRRTPPDTD